MVSAPGIQAGFTHHERVLNALRHQWFRHGTATARWGVWRGAQRLTASMVSAHAYRLRGICLFLVLNALRHQWFRHPHPPLPLPIHLLCSTPYGINGFGTVISPYRDSADDSCSTPYGINGFGTGNGGTAATLRHRAQRLTASMVSAPVTQFFSRTAIAVLNALRHQWFRHAPSLVRNSLVKPCSTPYGINGFGTFDNDECKGLLISAQRLTASMVSAPTRGGRCLCSTSCSTPYGINGFGT